MAPVSKVEAEGYGIFAVDMTSGGLLHIGVNGLWAPDRPLIAGRECCGPDDEGLLIVDVSRRSAVGLTPLNGQVVEWSPAGDAFLFAEQDRFGTPGGTYLVASDGRGIRRLTSLDGVWADRISWRPGTQEVAFERGGVFLLNLAAGSQRELVSPGGSENFIGEWSPDGRYLQLGYMKMIDAHTGRVLQLPDSCCLSIWSPDSTKIALSRYNGPGNPRSLFVMNASNLTTPVVQLPAEAGSAYGMAWSPDGRFLAYVNDGCHDGDWSLHRIDTETGENVTLLAGSRLRLGLEWSPDGRYLAYASYGPYTGSTFQRSVDVLDLWMGAERVLVDIPDDLSVRIDGWSSAGRYLTFVASGGFGICDG